MRRLGFILGLFSVGAQVLLLRELVSSLYGDELFIGIALFGWLTAVAVGAWFGGRLRGRPPRARKIFIVGSLLLPLVIIAVRLAPTFINPVIGEMIPFTRAAALSMAAMLPLGCISGLLFAFISRIGFDPDESIVTVYLFEGIGAFVGGVAITLCAGTVWSTLGMAVALGIVTLGMLYLPTRLVALAFSSLAIAVLLVVVTVVIPRLDSHIDGLKYPGFDVVASFDTHYGHQTILRRDGGVSLLTDNAPEGVAPDDATYEDLFIVPRLYLPEAASMLYIGRAEFFTGRSFPKGVTAVDPRTGLSRRLDEALPPGDYLRIHDDPIAFLTAPASVGTYDIIALSPATPDTYRAARLITITNLARLKGRLTPGGVLLVPAAYDSDRYLSPEKKRILGVYYQTLRETFKRVIVWPGSRTLFLASDGDDLNLPLDTLTARLESPAEPTEFIHPDYLFDRLNPLKTERLLRALDEERAVNSIDRPTLTSLQTLYRSLAVAGDHRLLSSVLGNRLWLMALPIGIIVLFVAGQFTGTRRSNYPLFLYFVAGIVSLSLELLSFYLFQTTVGSLYSELALLIGAFMLGLAVGTWYAVQGGRSSPHVQFALVLLLAATLIFLTMYKTITPASAVFFHACFLFVTAVGTGTLFVGATNRYYAIFRDVNRGAGYAAEIAGSAAGALLTTTILLPIIGLIWLLVSICGVLALALVGVFVRDSLHRG